MTDNLKNPAISEIAMRLHDLGWPIIYPRGPLNPREGGGIVVITVHGRCTITAEGYGLQNALLAALAEAKRFLSATVKTESCNCTDRSCEYCVKEDRGTA